MKKWIGTLVIIFFAFNVNAQLANSKWKATLQLDEAVDVVFNFSADTLEVTNAEDNSNIETMKYSLKDTVLTLQKLYGSSECDTGTMGSYSFTVNGDAIWIRIISDACNDRADVIKELKLTKMQQ